MGNNAVKSIVLIMVLVVLSFLIGAQVSDGLKDSIGAFAVIGAVVVGFALLLLGKNSWYLVFLFPPLVAIIPWMTGALAAFSVGIGFFVYHIIQCRVMGYARMKWHSAPLLDILMLVVLVYMCASYYRFPVAINVLGVDMEYVGGTPYVYALGAGFYFLLLSSLDVQRTELEKVLRWSFYVLLLGQLLSIIVRFKTGNIYWDQGNNAETGFSENVGESRITVFVPVCFSLFVFIYASRRLFTLLISPLALGVSGVSLAGLTLSGSRGALVNLALSCIGVSALRREMSVLVLMGVVVWGGLIGLGSSGSLEKLPHTAQRFLAIVPGVQISQETERDTTASADVRLIAWKQAFDPSNGYIRDYIWGDGFQRSVRELGRLTVARYRGTAARIDLSNDTLARTGNWHNGFIYTMHRLGLVGCLLFYMLFLCGMVLFFKVGSYYSNYSFFPYFCMCCVGAFKAPFIYSYNSQTPVEFFSSICTLALLKLLYCLLREQGAISSLFTLHPRYVPMTIREIEQQQMLR